MTKKNLIVFDFDGVICNSFYDSLYTAIYAYSAVCPENDLPLESPLIREEVFQFEENNEEFCRKFSELMPLGNFALDYFVALNILEKNIFDTIHDQEDFIKFKDTISPVILNEYSNIFYSFRSRLQKNEPDEWATLSPAFDNIPGIIKELSKKHSVAIATSKDINSLTILLAKYGIADCFNPGSILDKDFAESKREHLQLFHREFNLPYGNIHFIDDKVLHLISASDLGVHCYLAAWGFNTEREHKVAIQHGCQVLELPGLTDILA